MAKTDNHNPAAKLELRRYFLNKYHSKKPPSVFDCCQGSALLWTQLKTEFDIGRYWGVALKQKKGRLKVDSVRILEQPGWDFEVIDIDTYGEPWKHWEQVIANANQQLTIFLTIATIRMGGGGMISNVAKRELGISSLKSMPNSFCGKLSSIVTDFMLGKALNRFTIKECREAVSEGNARYIGIVINPKKPR